MTEHCQAVCPTDVDKGEKTKATEWSSLGKLYDPAEVRVGDQSVLVPQKPAV